MKDLAKHRRYKKRNLEASVKNKLDSLFFTQLFVSRTSQIAFIRQEKLHMQISLAVPRT